MKPMSSSMLPTTIVASAAEDLLAKVDPHRLDVLAQRMTGVGDDDKKRGKIESTSFFDSPSSRRGGGGGTTTTMVAVSPLPPGVSPTPKQQQRHGNIISINNNNNNNNNNSRSRSSSMSNTSAPPPSHSNDTEEGGGDDVSHSSCQTVHRANVTPHTTKEGGGGVGTPLNYGGGGGKGEEGADEGNSSGRAAVATTTTTLTVVGGSGGGTGKKKKGTPSWRPPSAIGHGGSSSSSSSSSGGSRRKVTTTTSSVTTNTSGKSSPKSTTNNSKRDDSLAVVTTTTTTKRVPTRTAATDEAREKYLVKQQTKAVPSSTTTTKAASVPPSSSGTSMPTTSTLTTTTSGTTAETSRSESQSRDTLHSYFGSATTTATATSSNQAHSNPSRSLSAAAGARGGTSEQHQHQQQHQLSSPPALQSKGTGGGGGGGVTQRTNNQRTLHSFLGITDGGGGGSSIGSSKKHGRGGGGGDEHLVALGMGDGGGGGNDINNVTSSKLSGPSSDTRAKRKKLSSKTIDSSSSSSSSAATISVAVAAATATASSQKETIDEIHRLQGVISDLRAKLDEANSRNDAIRNNQTLISAELQRRLRHRESELVETQRTFETRMVGVMSAMERLVREGSDREGLELRQRLATDGARLGRLVTSRVSSVGGGGGVVRSSQATTMIETWEDGHAPLALRMRRNELRSRREELEREWQDIRKVMDNADNFTSLSLPSSSNNINVQIGEDNDGGNVSSNSQTNDEMRVLNDNLDRMEVMETIRMHLDELRKKEMELDVEERALNIEKRAHVRALKLVSNEDTSKFRTRRKLHDRYVLMNLLGKGGFSEVWRAFDLHDARHVAVKIHQLESSWSDAKKENYTKHVSREYEIHREVRHPRIVSLYDVFEIDTDSFATVLECCGGTDLDTLLKDRGRLSERDARTILLQILCGMRYLSAPSADGRRQGIIHYDLKPGNILFDDKGNAKITDFGLSKIVDTADEGDSMELTSQGAGTYWYLPPECFLMDQDVRISNKVDVWSIGVIYYQMLFGRRPFGDGQSQDHILRNHIMLNATEVHFPSKPLITEEGKSFISDCLTYDQMSRPNIAQLCKHSYLKLATL